MNEIDLIKIEDGKMYRIECKFEINFNLNSIKNFKQVENTNYIMSLSDIICNINSIYALKRKHICNTNCRNIIKKDYILKEAL